MHSEKNAILEFFATIILLFSLGLFVLAFFAVIVWAAISLAT